MKKRKSGIALLLSAALAVPAISAHPFTVFGADETTIHLSNPATVNGVTTWDCVEFGRYWQADTNGDGTANDEDEMSPIKWRVLSVSDDDIFLMADQCLDWLSYDDPYNDTNESTWQTSFLREWLNSNFHNNAFNAEEQNAIKIVTVSPDNNPETGTDGGSETQDKLYVLSRSEITNMAYGFVADGGSESLTRRTQKTEFAKTMTKLAFKDVNDTGYWLRTPGDSHAKALTVESSGGIKDSSGLSVDSTKGVCPVVHITPSASSVLHKTDSVTSDSKNSNVPQKPDNTPKPPNNQNPAVTGKEVIKGKAPKITVKFMQKLKKGQYNRIRIKYKLTKGAVGYQIRYKKGKGSWTTLTRTKPVKPYDSVSIRGKGTYSFQIRSFTKDMATYSKWSKPKKVKVKKLYKA